MNDQREDWEVIADAMDALDDYLDNHWDRLVQAPERQWQMTRLAAGDYLLPSNNQHHLWRLERYDERDGTLSRPDGTVIHGTFWRLWRFRWGLEGVPFHDPTDWANWIEAVCLLPTRQAAIDEAMRWEVRNG